MILSQARLLRHGSRFWHFQQGEMRCSAAKTARPVNGFCGFAVQGLPIAAGNMPCRWEKGTPMKRTLFALSLGFGALILVTQAQAQVSAQSTAPQCGPRAMVLAQLADHHGESRRSMGIAANNMVMEVFASDTSQSWTIIVTTPQGQTCLVASGAGFEGVADALPAKGEPA
jgi:hypothetical protein